MSAGVAIARAIMVDMGPTTFQGYPISAGYAVITEVELDDQASIHRLRVSILGDERQIALFDAVHSEKFKDTVRCLFTSTLPMI